MDKIVKTAKTLGKLQKIGEDQIYTFLFSIFFAGHVCYKFLLGISGLRVCITLYGSYTVYYICCYQSADGLDYLEYI